MGGYAWTDYAKNILREHWPEKGSKETQKFIPYRKVASVLRMAVKMGLKSTNVAGIQSAAWKERTENTDSCDVNYFQTITPNSAYTLGNIYSDGCLRRWTLNFRCHSKDEEILLAIHKELKCKSEIKRISARNINERNNGPQTYFKVNSVCLVNRLKEQFGLCERKTYANTPMPKIPDEYFGHFLRGYFDGDGHISENKSSKYQGGSFSFCGTEQFILDMRSNISRLAEVPENKISVQNNLYTAAWYRHSHLKKIHTLIYPEGEYIFLSRKKEAFDRVVSLKIKTFPPFTEEEDKLILEKYKELGPSKLSRMMPHPTGSVWYRAKRLGIL